MVGSFLLPLSETAHKALILNGRVTPSDTGMRSARDLTALGRSGHAWGPLGAQPRTCPARHPPTPHSLAELLTCMQLIYHHLHVIFDCILFVGFLHHNALRIFRPEHVFQSQGIQHLPALAADTRIAEMK